MNATLIQVEEPRVHHDHGIPKSRAAEFRERRKEPRLENSTPAVRSRPEARNDPGGCTLVSAIASYGPVCGVICHIANLHLEARKLARERLEGLRRKDPARFYAVYACQRLNLNSEFTGPSFISRLFAGEDRGVQPMLDVFMLVIGIGFFALAVGYALACDRL